MHAVHQEHIHDGGDWILVRARLTRRHEFLFIPALGSLALFRWSTIGAEDKPMQVTARVGVAL